MPSDITIRQLRYFVAAAQSGQISMAAANEHVSQSAVTNAVSSLESALGTRLFERLPHGVALTLDGHDFYNHARHVLDSLSDALHKSRSRSKEAQGTVRIGASYTVLGYFLPEVLARFAASYPQVHFELHDLDRATLEASVASGGIDVGVAILSNLESIGRFEHRSLVISPRKLWVAPSHPLAKIQRPTLRDIAAHRYIMLTVDEGEESALRYWKKVTPQPDVFLRTGSMEALRGLVSHGFGVTILSEMVFRPWSLEGKRIEAREIADPVPQMDVGMLWKKGSPLSPAASAFVDFLGYGRGV
ncbi:LysR family transcriptional regulator [Caballeronia grimmiae]|uniref:Transcriptional regulator n=1 Tax=Caballeronia grimmiae TaxID=1071679 RepID=A0A069P5M6_9BURK|nr:LysR family transcriptional regulator [Caballeronia grimmiae]KDR35169.1 LysR family transcriptional regulator [Caballeronia grimmiae]GGD72830.1 transcriptional regulator [Caballeronia grimmiae]